MAETREVAGRGARRVRALKRREVRRLGLHELKGKGTATDIIYHLWGSSCNGVATPLGVKKARLMCLPRNGS
ncbi:MAG: hypothetical protein SGI73_09175 [Chloroflexota bacterium]|nr:hypothetical protein [Chloroflexota bacterium]